MRRTSRRASTTISAPSGPASALGPTRACWRARVELHDHVVEERGAARAVHGAEDDDQVGSRGHVQGRVLHGGLGPVRAVHELHHLGARAALAQRGQAHDGRGSTLRGQPGGSPQSLAAEARGRQRLTHGEWLGPGRVARRWGRASGRSARSASGASRDSAVPCLTSRSSIGQPEGCAVPLFLEAAVDQPRAAPVGLRDAGWAFDEQQRHERRGDAAPFPRPRPKRRTRARMLTRLAPRFVDRTPP